jgi:predicted 3-demethylubiquinone-9 3-methyltransferase (glyoxalase superfamily)
MRAVVNRIVVVKSNSPEVVLVAGHFRSLGQSSTALDSRVAEVGLLKTISEVDLESKRKNSKCLESGGHSYGSMDKPKKPPAFMFSIFSDSKVVRTTRYGEAEPGPKGDVMTVEFELDGQESVALNAGLNTQIYRAVLFSAECKTQEEVDGFWKDLAQGGEGPCGWLKDKCGPSWQIDPKLLPEMLNDPDPQKSKTVMEAMLKMKKIDIQALNNAYEQ